MTRRPKTAYLTRRLARAHNDLANPYASNEQRRAACRQPCAGRFEVDRLAARTRRVFSDVR